MSVRVRFAPSPTGYLHVGGARTALFNWLFARRNDGEFVLRIEDTDQERSSMEMVSGILEGLEWLGLSWDEGPFFQSERLEIYRETALWLLREGHAYRDFTPRESSSTDYREFRDLGEEESRRRAASESFALRFKVPSGEKIRFSDLVYGEISVDSSEIEDFVILRSDGTPTYHLSVVADDTEMRISHVIRGVDHLSNTGKHVLLFRALGVEIPLFAHLPLILGTDKKRLSKRHGATSVTEYAKRGLLPDAVRNYLALLGWSSGDDQEILDAESLLDRFRLERVNKANAVFDPSKLEWLNRRFISSASAEALAPQVRNVLRQRGLWDEEWSAEKRAWFLSTIDLLKTRVEDLDDFAHFGEAFFSDAFSYEGEAVEKYLEPKSDEERQRLLSALDELQRRYSALDEFNLDSTEKVLREVAQEHGLKAGVFIGAVRVATTGRLKAPGIFDVLVTLGREQTLARLERLMRFLQ